MRDADAVALLHADLTRLGHSVWRDVDIVGGQKWWSEICDEIRTCEVFVLAYSANAARSRYCLAELEYAVALCRAVLPVEVAATAPELAPPVLRDIQRVSYTARDADAALALAKALMGIAVTKGDDNALPPALPLSELASIRDQVMAPELTAQAQEDLLEQLTRNLQLSDDVVVELVRMFRARTDLDGRVATALDVILERDKVAAMNDVTSRVLVRALMSHVMKGRLTPVLGSGLSDRLIGSGQKIAAEWAKSFEFPLSSKLLDDLPTVAQYIKVTAGEVLMRESFEDRLSTKLRRKTETADAKMNLDELFIEVWRGRPIGPLDPHEVLARLPCPIYITTQSHQVLEQALREAGKHPRSDLCRWTDDNDHWPPSVFVETEDGTYSPSEDEPLVFHLFGRLDLPDSLVLTEDDYFDLLIHVTEDRSRIPACVRRALADSALLLLGLKLDDLEFRILWRALLRQEGASRLGRYKNVAAQLDLAGSVISVEGARQYMREYFGKVTTPTLDIYWGSVDDFISTLDVESRSTS